MCRAFKKRTTSGQTKTNIEGWDSSYFYEEASGVSSMVDPIDLISRQQPHQGFLAHQNFLCKQEIDNLSCMHNADQFVQLPQLESPSLPLIKRPTSTVSLGSENNELDDHDHQNRLLSNNNNTTKKVTDWRDLDKFVASQLSHETDQGLSGFDETHPNSDMALLLLQSSRDDDQIQGNKLGPFLNPSSDCDIGICVFEK